MSAWHPYENKPRTADNIDDKMKGSYLGPAFSNENVEARLKTLGAVYRRLDEKELYGWVADELAAGKVVGWHQGRMEFGPRSLGGRSILGDARNTKMQSVLNLKIKYRESFRPFAPSVLKERVSDYFDIDRESPYMLLVAPVKKEIRQEMTVDEQNLFGLDKLHVVRSSIPGITHVDYSARIQTVDGEHNKAYYQMKKKFDEKQGCPVIINTSFNVRGEPIVCTPEDAYLCFMRTNMDYPTSRLRKKLY